MPTIAYFRQRLLQPIPMNKTIVFISVFCINILCSAQGEDACLKNDINGLTICDKNGSFYSKAGNRIGRLSYSFNTEYVRTAGTMLNDNYQAPPFCFEGSCLLLMLIDPENSVFEIRQLHSYTSAIDSAVFDAVAKTEALLPAVFSNCDSSFYAPLILYFDGH